MTGVPVTSKVTSVRVEQALDGLSNHTTTYETSSMSVANLSRAVRDLHEAGREEACERLVEIVLELASELRPAVK